MCVYVLSHVQLFTAPELPAQALLPMEFSRQEYWKGLSFPTPGDHPHPVIEPVSLASPALVGGFFTTVPPGKPYGILLTIYMSLKVQQIPLSHLFAI